MSKYKPPRFLGRREILRALRAYGCIIKERHGKGNHCLVSRKTRDGNHKYTLPEHRLYGHDYIGPLRRTLHLTASDNVPDREFYLRAKGKRK